MEYLHLHQLVVPTNVMQELTLPSVAFTGDVHLSTCEIERLHEVLPEAHKVRCNIHLVLDLWRGVFGSGAEACSNWLIHPDHVR